MFELSPCLYTGCLGRVYYINYCLAENFFFSLPTTKIFQQKSSENLGGEQSFPSFFLVLGYVEHKNQKKLFVSFSRH